MNPETEKQLKLLQFQKSNAIIHLTKLHSLSNALLVESDDSTEFEVRFSKLESHYKAINSFQNEVVECMITLGLNDEIENEKKVVDEVDKMYFDILGTHKKLFPCSSNVENKDVSSCDKRETPLNKNVHPQVKLPQIDLPNFNGNVKDWPHFKDMFQSLIHDNTVLSEIEKFHYLMSCLKSEPLTLCKTLPLTGQNYSIIWNQLNERYDNKRILASCYIEEIINAPCLNDESSKKLRPFLDLLSENFIALKSMTFPIDYGNFILCHIALQKLDKHTRQLFERKYSCAEFPTFENLMFFLKDHCKALEATCFLEKVQGSNFQNGISTKPQFNPPKNKFINNKFSNCQSQFTPRKAFLSTNNVHDNSSNQKCLVCNNNHTIYRCPEFTALSTKERKDFIISKQACFNCLSHGHTSKSCASRLLCRKCSRHHHTMLHESPQTHSTMLSASKSYTDFPADQKTLTQPEPQSISSSQPMTTHVGTSLSTTILGTAVVQIQDSTGDYHTVRALCDPGSQVSFITKECANKLCLPLQISESLIQGISESTVKTSNESVSCYIKPCNKNHPCLQVNAIILDCITSPLPCNTLPPNIKEFYKNIELADPFFDIPSKIDILIGADLFAEVFDGGRKPLKTGYPTPYKTIFGWVLIGKTMINDSLPSNMTSHLCTSGIHSLDISLKKFWEVEEPPQKVHISLEDQLAEKLFTQATERDYTGRYVVKLPFRSEPPHLGNSNNSALHSFYNLESRLVRNKELKEQYTQFMQDYEELGHMSPVDINKVKPIYFIPHHEVFKYSQDGKTRQIRVVYNASAKTTNGKSLNDELLIGPKLQNNICEIISNFRLFPVVFTADIAKMYRQILIHPDHQKYQAILWRQTPQEPIGCYQLNTVTYGVSSAPFLAIRTLQQLAKDEGQSFPLAAKVLTKDIFVDDILTGTFSIEDAISLKHELVSLLKLGGFELKKWASNHSQLLQDATKPNKEITFRDDSAIKVLGIKWQPKSDCFSYEVNIKNNVINKRGILSLLSSIYDPLGWVTPTILWAKKLMQTLWTLGVNWDEPLSEDIKNSWSQFVSELPLLESLQIPRLVLPVGFHNVQLHAFCDASSDGYGACLYLRSVTVNGITVNLVMAKSKVAPLKSLTIPKLELCAAVLLCKLVKFYRNTVSETIGEIPIFAWTDSTVSLSWIRTSPHLLKTFVANRVATIQDIIEPSCWFYVPTLDNPADSPSRGLLPSKIISHSLWWNGPNWLSDEPSAWPAQDHSRLLLNEMIETKSTAVSFIALDQNQDSDLHDVLKRFSSLTRLKRVTAWCLRFIRNCRVNVTQRDFGQLSASELNDSIKVCVKNVQNKSFTEELRKIKLKQACKSEIQRLDPFIDEEGILRVGGRLRHSSLQYSARHPIILPKNSPLTILLIDHYHNMYFHIGPRTLQSLIQRSYWILSSRNAIRKRIRKCVKCTRMQAKYPQPFMADLPDYRVNNYRPFLKVGIDFGGPFQIKSDRRRNPQILKAYLCLIICLSTKALHLEVVSNLSTDAFLAAFDRFIARRGLCTHVYTDRGTNFVGAKSTLNELYKLVHHSENKNQIASTFANKGINWTLNPPSAPHFGGIWEAGIKSAKTLLLRVIGNQKLTFEELTTLFTQIEAILNSRPLCLLSTDPEETNVLTPGHFLIGQPLVSIPQPDITASPQNRLSRWQMLHQTQQHFWHRWSREYLHTLQQRSKWNVKSNSNAKIGDVVLIKDSNLLPQIWKMGKITALLPGPDNITRVVKLQTDQGEIIRPIIKLCPLPVND